MTSISEIYNKMLANGTNDFERVGWGSIESQEKRFHVLTEIGDLENTSVLDVGCGLGAYYDHINKIFSNIVYTGLDINPNMIQAARKRLPNIEFMHVDLVSDKHVLNNRKFDYVFLSGALNLSADRHGDMIKDLMRIMFSLANKGVAINFLSVFSDYLTPGEYYCNPADLLQIAFSLTKKVTLRHDYMSHDFTIYLYK